MRGIEKAVEKADRDGFDTGLAQYADRIAHRGLVECGFETSVVEQPFGHFAAEPALDQYRGFVRLKVVKIWPPLPADLEQVAKAVSGVLSRRCESAMLYER